MNPMFGHVKRHADADSKAQSKTESYAAYKARMAREAGA